MFWIDQKYISLLSPRLNLFKRVENNYNFRCPYCGDSRSNKFKARGYLIQRETGYSYYCHNCGQTADLKNFIKFVDPQMYAEYLTERFSQANTTPVENKVEDQFKFEQPIFQKNNHLKKLKKVSQLKHNHPVKQYVVDRKIPNPYHAKLFYCLDFGKWVNQLLGYEKIFQKEERRLIIPFFDQQKNMFALQGRAFSKDAIRYITIIIDKDKPKIYGLDTVDSQRTVYIFEGPIDSMFIENSVAMAGSAGNVEFDDKVFVYDNEPRNLQIVERMQKVIEQGDKICIWPKEILWKDVNDMVIGGLTVDNIKSIIDNNTFNGLEAMMALQAWRKI